MTKKQLRNLGSITAIILTSIMTSPAFAGGVSAEGSLTYLKTWLYILGPVVFVIGLMCVGIAYSKGWVRKEQLGQYAIGLVIFGPASEIVGLVLPSAN